MVKKARKTPNNHLDINATWTNEGGMPKEDVLFIVNSNVGLDAYFGGITPVYMPLGVMVVKAKMLKDGESEYVDVVYDEENDCYVASDETEISYSMEEDGEHFEISANVVEFIVEDFAVVKE